MISKSLKRRMAEGLQRFALLRWLLAVAVRLFAPKNHVGVVGAIFNNAGQVLLVEHVFRPYYSWGLPGGWVEPGENPAQTMRRELKEELALQIQVKKLLFCEPQGLTKPTNIPPSLNLAYYCRLTSEEDSLKHIKQARNAYEVLSAQWIDPEKIEWKLNPLQLKAVILGKQEFEQESSNGLA